MATINSRPERGANDGGSILMPFSLYIYVTYEYQTDCREDELSRSSLKGTSQANWLVPQVLKKDATREVKFGDRRKGVSPQSGREDELSRSWRAHPTFFLCSLSCHVESDFTRLPVVSKNLQGQRQTPG